MKVTALKALIISLALIFTLNCTLAADKLRDYGSCATSYSSLAQTARQLPRSKHVAVRKKSDDIDFNALKSINPHVCAWIMLPDTKLNYPVVHGEDNEHYLYHLFSGERNRAGAIFCDARNSGGFTDKNTILYGHHMKDRSMFGELLRYRNQQYFESHPKLSLTTPEGSYTLEIFAAYTECVPGTAWRRDFESDGDFLEWAESAKAKSAIKSGVKITAQDRCVTLSTCAYEFPNARFVVMAKLVKC